MDSDAQLEDDDSADDIILLPEDGEFPDALQAFLAWLDSVDAPPPDDRTIRKRLRIETRLPMLVSTYFSEVVIADCMLVLVLWITVVTSGMTQNYRHDQRIAIPSLGFSPTEISNKEKPLILNIGFDVGPDYRQFGEPLLFYAGASIPVDEWSPILRRESRLYQDLEVNLADVIVVIRADERCPHGIVVEAIRIAQEAGFVNFRLRVRI